MNIDNTIEQNNTLTYFQNFLDTVNIIKCCKGTISTNQNDNIKTLFGPQYVQCNSQWHHKNCLIIIEDPKKCV